MLQTPRGNDLAVTAQGRIATLDRARTVITLLVVLHHLVINCTPFGHGDRMRWLGFDLVELFNDSFFMACMFFHCSFAAAWCADDQQISLAGAPGDWVRHFFSIFILMPVAHYPTFLRYHLPGTTDFNFLHFWWHMLTIGPWPSGSAWCLWVFAFYYPNNDVLNGGRPTPAARMDAMAGLGPFSGSYAYAATDSTANGASCAQRYHSYEPASGTFLGYGGRRHKCE